MSLRVVHPEDQPDGTYRLSGRAIRIWTRVLVLVIVIGVVVGGAGLIVAAAVDSEVLAIAGMSTLGAAILLPLLLGAYLGGESLARFGGLVGLVLVAGMIVGATGSVIGSWIAWLGLALVLLATAGFFVMGFSRRVPMSIGGVHVHPQRPRDLVYIVVGILGAGAIIASSWVGIWLLVVGVVLESVPITWATVAERHSGLHVARQQARKPVSPAASPSRDS
ncbi:hypothetical protein GCM10009840_25680 [Pseudolysinimonas kribbensis]|uniref:Uncharacterized protein n=1 Tax=Pseudolysinimonas kribbensis TaxID=433641 RepID=A0ABQ6K7K8_9MICO|nr:hypothetical protein [Pseudolysinimonas kribbensis]GMA96641.1 hypothetical protein GCM10025881_34650 [Pseudolysinimonas kribbensis]